jgi:hypothetical protein
MALTIDPVIIVTKNPATAVNTMCTSTRNCWGKVYYLQQLLKASFTKRQQLLSPNFTTGNSCCSIILLWTAVAVLQIYYRRHLLQYNFTMGSTCCPSILL